ADRVGAAPPATAGGVAAFAERAAQGPAVAPTAAGTKPGALEPHPAFHSTGISAAGRNLHAPGLHPEISSRSGLRRTGRKLAGRFFLPLPWLALRPCRSRHGRFPRATESARAPALLQK